MSFPDSFFEGDKLAMARLNMFARLPYDVPTVLQDAADRFHFSCLWSTVMGNVKVRIDKPTIGAHILVISKFIPALYHVNDSPYSQEKIEDLDNCAKAMEHIFMHLPRGVEAYRSDDLRQELCLRIPRYLYENGIHNSVTLFLSPYEPVHDLAILINYAVYVCSLDTKGQRYIETPPAPKQPKQPKRPSLGRKLTSFGKSVADKFT